MKPNKSKIELFKPGVEKLPANLSDIELPEKPRETASKLLDYSTKVKEIIAEKVRKGLEVVKKREEDNSPGFFTRIWQWVKKVPDKLSKGYDFIVSLPQTIANVKSIGWVLAVVVIGAIIIIVLLKI